MLEVKHLTVCSKEGKPLVRDVSFTLIPGEPLGLTLSLIHISEPTRP